MILTLTGFVDRDRNYVKVSNLYIYLSFYLFSVVDPYNFYPVPQIRIGEKRIRIRLKNEENISMYVVSIYIDYLHKLFILGDDTDSLG